MGISDKKLLNLLQHKEIDSLTFTDKQRRSVKECLPELIEINRLIHKGKGWLKAYQKTLVEVEGVQLPVVSLEMGNPDADSCIVITAGVHGLERIGTQVVVAYLETLLERLDWDLQAKQLLNSVRIVCLPLVNPGGMYIQTRANPNGVDLMRNSPISAFDKAPMFLGGQRISKRLPWYCGQSDSMEIESQALQEVVIEQVTRARFAITIDCHSGFGFDDRIWFPYAYRKRPMANIDKVIALKFLLDRTYPNHSYIFEPQSTSYLTHGDLWDHLYKRAKNELNKFFLPLTLEMGAWTWVKKRPRQAFSALGLFNPITPHRQARVLRRHILLFDFLCAAAMGYNNWIPGEDERANLTHAAMSLWYKHLVNRLS